MNKKTKKNFLITSVLLVLLLPIAIYAVYKYAQGNNPGQEIKMAIDAMTEAKTRHSDLFVPELTNEAAQLYQQAMDEWKIQNQKFLLRRDFTQVKFLAAKSAKIYHQAVLLSVSEKKEVYKNATAILRKLENSLQTFDKNYRHLPLEKTTFEQNSLANLNYKEALTLFDKNQLHEAEKLASKALVLIDKANTKGKAALVAFYADFPLWEENLKWANQHSAKGKTVILINKMESSCSVIRSGKTITEFKTEFGQNWLGDKVKMGDKATPEGIYKIVRKKNKKETKFYKSLLLDYPNEFDKVKFAERIKKGEIPKNAHIGNYIEIHGYGGKGVNWTDGCVALENKDMDRLFEFCSENTP
ncbi:MAG: L,D-transpeptidase family protein, partial [Bacteroidales bacterium]|nr:L,D-transpeptidase family protein [Bacteroidales bacterium]